MIPSSSPASTVKTLKSNSSSSNLQASSYGSLPADIEEGASDDDDDDADGRVFRKHSVIELAPGPVNDEVAVVANTINSILGVSLFAMPWGFQQSGMLGGIIVLSIVAWLSFETARMLLVSQNTCYRRFGDVLSYPDIAGITLGATWSKVVRIATILSCLGGCTGYLIFFGETVGQALSLASETVILAATVPLILLSWIRSFRELTIFAVFGVVSLVVTVVVVLLDGSRQIRSLDDMPPLFKPRTLPAFMGPATFLFTIHYIILAMGAEALKQRPWMTFHTTAADGRANSSLVYSIGLSYFISLVLVVLVGGSGYMMYRNVMVVTDLSGQPMIGCEGHVCQNVILNLSPGLSRDLVGLAMSVVIILSYILILAPAREHIENEALRRLELTESRESMFRNFLRTCLVLSTVIVAIQAPYFGSVMGAVGGLTDALQSFVFPPLIFLVLEKDMVSKLYRAYSMSIVCIGLVVVGYTCMIIIQAVLFDFYP